MDEDIRQNDLQLLQVLNNFPNGSITENDALCLASRSFDLLSEEEHNMFSNAIHFLPNWEHTKHSVQLSDSKLQHSNM